MSSGQQFLNVMILPPCPFGNETMANSHDHQPQRSVRRTGLKSAPLQPSGAGLRASQHSTVLPDYGSWRPVSPPTGVWPLALSPLEQRHAAAVTSGSCPPAVATHGAGLGGRRTDADGNDLDRVQGRQHVSA